MTKPNKSEEETSEGDPICEKCGSAKLLENEKWICTHCDGEINFFGDSDE